MKGSHPAHISYEPGYIVLSYFISLAGCATTLELLQRRTSIKGAYNWYLLLASCICMGGIGIWCMHFIGNRAIVLDHGIASLQINYNTGFTAVSFFLPILVLLLAFYFLGASGKATSVYIVLAGILTGTAVCGMHYVGQLGIANYNCTYASANVAGSAVIAVAASLIALSIFFRLRETWTNTWWKRGFCAALLAGAVSGMHWTATVGTAYFPNGHDQRSAASRVQTIIVCAVLSIASCTVLLFIALVTGRKNRIARTRAQQVVLACAYFDTQGRLMLTPEGTLPCRKITDHFVEKNFGGDELSRSHSTFMWIYRASRSWDTLQTLIPSMQAFLESDPVAWRYQPGNRGAIVKGSEYEVPGEFTFIFKQLFCVAAQHLASTLRESLPNLGTLFEEPFETGTITRRRRSWSLKEVPNLVHTSSPSDVERASVETFIVGRGKYLFLTRQLKRSDITKFAALGYRFGTASQVGEVLARSVQVSHSEMVTRLERMRLVSGQHHLPLPGVYLACFFCRPSVQKSFDVLVPDNLQSQLPMTVLPVDNLDRSYEAVLKYFDEWPLRRILKVLVNGSNELDLDNTFRWQLHNSLARLIEMVGDSDLMMGTVFSAQPFQAPSRSVGGSPITCTIYSLRAMGTIHSSSPHKDLCFVPLTSFSAQQSISASPKGQDEFLREVKREFGFATTPHPREKLDVSDLVRTKRSKSDTPTSPTREVDHSKIGLKALLNYSATRLPSRGHKNSGGGFQAGSMDSQLSLTDLRGDKDSISMPDIIPADVTLVPDDECSTEGVTESIPERPDKMKSSWATDLFAMFRL